MVELEDRYTITSNRESGFGRYDVLMEPKNCGNDAYILEFKVFDQMLFFVSSSGSILQRR